MHHLVRFFLALAIIGWSVPAWAAGGQAVGLNFFLSALACVLALALCVQFAYLVMRRLLRTRARQGAKEPEPSA